MARRIFGESMRHGSYSGVARTLNAEGVRSREGLNWTPNVIRRLVGCRHVLGEFFHDGEWHQGQHEAIIDVEAWNRAQSLGAVGAKYGPGGRSGRLPKRHLFVRGMLRCGECDEAMLPRSDKESRDTYVCRGRKQLGTCDMPVLGREDVDVAALRLFEQGALDYEATRDHVAAQLQATVTDTQAQMERARREAATSAARLDRVRRDYQDGKLDADDWSEQRAQLAGEQAAVVQEAERLERHAGEALGTLQSLDAESETLRRLADLRAAVAGRIADAGQDIAALRAVIAEVFADVKVVRDGGLYVVPRPIGTLPDGGITLRAKRAAIPFSPPSDKSTDSGVPE
jgi:hypothetical protein